MSGVGRSWWRVALPALLAVLSAGPALAQPSAPASGADGAAPVKVGPGAASEVSAPGAATAAPAAAIPAPAAGTAVPAAATSDPLSPMRLMDGPSLRETGRIAVPTAAAPLNLIERQDTPNSPKEKSITPAASSIDVAPVPAAAGFIDPRVLDREITERFTQIANCRVEVARAKQVTPAQVVADTLMLRWIIERDGSTGPTDVVATSPVDLGIMDCAKRVMSQWTFTAPRGGRKAVERPFTFTGNPPPAAR